MLQQGRGFREESETLFALLDTVNDQMSIAQCFAGPPEAPPAPGSRFRQV